MKDQLAGLLWMGDVPPAELHGSLGGIVVEVPWSTLNPTQGVWRWTTVDAVVKASPLPVRLRILGGKFAPEWAKRAAGAPLSLVEPPTTGNPHPGTEFTVPRWWEQDFLTVRRGLVDTIATYVDANPNIAEVAFGTGVTTEFCEWPIRQMASATNRANYLAAGYTVTADWAAIVNEATWLAGSVKQTNVYVADSGPLQGLDLSAAQGLDYVRALINMMPGSTIHGTNNLDGYESGLPAVYRLLRKPMSFQMRAPGNAANPLLGLSQAATLGARSVEIQPGYLHSLGAGALATAHKALLANR
jgi:hypothetical protein